MLDEDTWMADTDAMAAKHDRAVTIGMVEDQPVALVCMNVCDESEPEICLLYTSQNIKSVRADLGGRRRNAFQALRLPAVFDQAIKL